MLLLLSFFFSSRRRHTSSKRDWSSDVCSSDLLFQTLIVFISPLPALLSPRRLHRPPRPSAASLRKIGRASCRERVQSAVGGAAVDKTDGREPGLAVRGPGPVLTLVRRVHRAHG